jgi:AraC-like DNA-binding protein
MDQVRIAAIDGFLELVRRTGGDPAPILSKSGLPTSFFEDHESDDFMGYEQVEILLQTAADMTNCPHFGALLGSQQSIRLLGIIGYVMQQSSNARVAIDQLIDHFTLHVKGGSIIELSIAGDHAMFSYKVTGDFKKVSQTNELAMAESIVVLRAIFGNSWKPTAVLFTHKTPTNLRPYSGIFRGPVSFNQDENQVLFPRDLLNRKISSADPELNKILLSHVELLKKEMLKNESSSDLCTKVETLIRQTLPLGKISSRYIASLMSVHRRTLHRMLKGEGISFTAILENVRKSIAIDRLQNSDISIIQLANYLGYADNSAFTRSFKRWTGKTPQQWKNKPGTNGPPASRRDDNS